jgi:3,4-dihydroxy 2-butanone 4-phosphate synthase / GTP cyclohydrolase II
MTTVAPVVPERLGAAVGTLRLGGAVLLLDDCPDGGDAPQVAMVAAAAGFDVKAAAAFMRLGGGGTMIVVGPEERLQALRLRRGDTVTAARAVAGGVSASDRALTCRVLATPTSSCSDVRRPGQVLVEVAADGGLLFREGLEEAALDLIRLAHAGDAAVLVFPVDEFGEPVHPRRLGGELGQLPSVALDDVLLARLATERVVEHVVATTIPTRYGTFTGHGYRACIDGAEHLALTMGEIDDRPTLTRVHQACPAGDVFRAECGCRRKLEASLHLISQVGRGAVVYLAHASDVHDLRHPGRPMDAREIGLGAQMLLDLGIRRMELITTSDRVFPHLTTFGLKITARVAPVLAPPQPA